MLGSPAYGTGALVLVERLMLKFIFLHQYQSGLCRLPSCFGLAPGAVEASQKSAGLGRAEGWVWSCALCWEPSQLNLAGHDEITGRTSVPALLSWVCRNWFH